MNMRSLEEKQAEARARNKQRRSRQRSKAVRAAIAAKKPKGNFPHHAKGSHYSFERCLVEYKKEFDDIVDLVINTCRSQTLQSHPNKDIQFLSNRILWKYRWINPVHIDREEIESELMAIWWLAYKRSREKGWSVKANIMKYSSYFLPRWLAGHITSVYKTNTDELSYELDPVEPFSIDLDYVINGSEVWPACLFDREERYLIFLLQEYPGEYARVARIMRVPKLKVWRLVRQVRERISKELDINASKNTAGSSERRSLVSA